jgi:hypothetical protein
MELLNINANMRKLFILYILTALLLPLRGQNSNGSANDAARIALAVYIPDQIVGLSPEAKGVLSGKLNQIATKNGIGGSVFNERFIMTANVVELTKDITTTTPPFYIYTLGVTLYIGDGIDGTKFANQYLELKGTGRNESKAYLEALRGLKPEDSKYATFIETGKNRIIEYYNSKCDFLLKEAQAMASQNDYDGAIAKLVSVPEVCKECYNKAMDAVAPIYQKQIDRQCKIVLNDATNTWNASQDVATAESVASILVKIDPNASCFTEVKALAEKIAIRINELDKRANSIQDREWNLKLKEQQDDVDITKSRIKSARDIGVAYGKNQPQTKVVVYKVNGWW